MTIFSWNSFNAESANKKSGITAGFLILQTPRKYLLLCSLLTFCCLQSVKDTKFESNSQLYCVPDDIHNCCLQSVKDTKFESNSQLQRLFKNLTFGCLQSVKDTKFESNSQLYSAEAFPFLCCLQSVKEAIHNNPDLQNVDSGAVCSPSKIQSLKAIHNS